MAASFPFVFHLRLQSLGLLGRLGQKGFSLVGKSYWGPSMLLR